MSAVSQEEIEAFIDFAIKALPVPFVRIRIPPVRAVPEANIIYYGEHYVGLHITSDLYVRMYLVDPDTDMWCQTEDIGYNPDAAFLTRKVMECVQNPMLFVVWASIVHGHDSYWRRWLHRSSDRTEFFSRLGHLASGFVQRAFAAPSYSSIEAYASQFGLTKKAIREQYRRIRQNLKLARQIT